MFSGSERINLLSKLLQLTAEGELAWQRTDRLPVAVSSRPIGPAYRMTYLGFEFLLFRFVKETIVPTADIEPRVIGHERLRLVILDDGAPVAEIEDDSQLQSLFNRVRLGLSNAKARLAPLLDETVSSGAE